MESKIPTTSDVLLKALSMDLPDSAEYVLSRERVSYCPQSAQTYRSQTGCLIMFVLGGGSGAMLDPTSVRLSYLLVNTAASVAAPANYAPANAVQLLGPQAIFSRCRTLVNGSLAEDLLQYNQLVSMMGRLQPSARRYTDLLENNWVEPLYPPTRDGAPDLNSRRFVHCIASGLFAQDRMLYLKTAPLTIELELVGDPNEACAGGGHTWQVTDLRLLANIVYLTPEFLDQITSSLLRGIALPIAYQTFAVQRISFTPAGNAFSVQLNRSLTRISKLFWTLTRPVADVDANQTGSSTAFVPIPFAGTYLLERTKWQNSAYVAPNAGNPQTTRWQESELWKEVNCFAHPALGNLNAATDTMEWSVLFGSKQLPVIPVRSVAESAWYLRAALGQSWYGSHDLVLKDFCNTSFIACISFDRTLNCAGEGNPQFGGLSSVQGAQITLNVRNMPPVPDPQFNRLTIYLQHDAIASIRAEATEILL